MMLQYSTQAAGERFEQLKLGYTLFYVQVTESRVHTPLNFHTMTGSREQIIDELLDRLRCFTLSSEGLQDETHGKCPF